MPRVLFGAILKAMACRLTWVIVSSTWWQLACAPSAPAVSAGDYDPARPINARLEGRLVFRSFDDHHPSCFVVDEGTGASEEVACPSGAVHALESCPGGKLYLAEERVEPGCVCVPLSDDAAVRVACP
jgi:hypothetical protein